MDKKSRDLVENTKQAAIKVLLHAGWGYPEPYTRDLMISSLGILLSGNTKLIKSLRRTLETVARNQSRLGHIPSMVHNSDDRGSSDCTPLFLMGVALYRKVSGEEDFLEQAVNKSMLWMEYQSPSDRVIVDQLPTSDWRDEQWVCGYGLFVNTIVYSYLRLLGQLSRPSDQRPNGQIHDKRGPAKPPRS